MADGNFGGGAGTQADPLLIEDFADLNAVRDELDKWYKLVTNVDLDGFTWEPIGSGDPYSTLENAFTGGFDGDGYTISNLFVDKEDDFAGFFGALNHEDSVLENITLEDATVAGEGRSGILVGVLREGTVKNCRVIGSSSITAGPRCGGLIGENDPGGHIMDSYSEADVSARSDEWGDGDANGGFIGVCDGPIERCYATGNVVGGENAQDDAGFAGIGHSDGHMQECYATGNVEGRMNVGGFVGANSALITNCYAIGDITINHGWSGGFAGETYETITNCYFAGDIDNQGGEDNEVHGFMGLGGDYTVSCYFDSEVSGFDEDAEDSQAQAATTAELQGGTGEPVEPQTRSLVLVHNMDSQQRNITWPEDITWLEGSAPSDPEPDETLIVRFLHMGLEDGTEHWFAEAWDVGGE